MILRVSIYPPKTLWGKYEENSILYPVKNPLKPVGK
jgi:hypothetical protein